MLEVSASLGMSAAPWLLILWWRLLSYAGLGDWDAARRSSPRPAGRWRRARGRTWPTAWGPSSRARRGGRGDADVAAGPHRGGPRRGPRLRRLLRDPHRARASCRSPRGRPGAAPLARELAEEGLALADRYGFDWYRARAALLSASAHAGTPLGDERLAQAVDLTGAARPRDAVEPTRAAPGRAPARAGPRGRPPRRAGRRGDRRGLRPRGAARGRRDRPTAHRPGPPWPTRSARRPTSTPRRCACCWPTGTRR